MYSDTTALECLCMSFYPLVSAFGHSNSLLCICTTFHRYPIFSTRYSVICKVYTGYCGTSEIEHGLCACTVDNSLAKARGLSLRTGAQPMLYLPLKFKKNILRYQVVYNAEEPSHCIGVGRGGARGGAKPPPPII